jgi:hypothetical protein
VGRKPLAAGLLALALAGLVSGVWLVVRSGRDEEPAEPAPAVAAPDAATTVPAATPPAPPVPAPFAVAAGSPPEALAGELERFRTGVFAIDLEPSGGGAQPLAVRVRVDRPVYPLLLFLDAAGELYRLYPFGVDAGEPLAAGQDAVLPPQGAAGGGFAPSEAGWIVVLLSTTPPPQRLVLGARPEQGGLFTRYPRLVRGREDAFPAHDYLAWLTGELRARREAWDLRTLAWRG